MTTTTRRSRYVSKIGSLPALAVEKEIVDGWVVKVKVLDITVADVCFYDDQITVSLYHGAGRIITLRERPRKRESRMTFALRVLAGGFV